MTEQPKDPRPVNEKSLRGSSYSYVESGQAAAGPAEELADDDTDD